MVRLVGWRWKWRWSNRDFKTFPWKIFQILKDDHIIFDVLMFLVHAVFKNVRIFLFLDISIDSVHPVTTRQPSSIHYSVLVTFNLCSCHWPLFYPLVCEPDVRFTAFLTAMVGDGHSFPLPVSKCRAEKWETDVLSDILLNVHYLKVCNEWVLSFNRVCKIIGTGS